MAADQIRCWFTLDAAAKPVGPYTVEDLLGYAASGYVSEAQVFWKEGAAGWLKVSEIPELAAVHKAVQAFTQQHPAAAAAAQHAHGSHPHPHVTVLSGKPSDPLDAFKHEIQAVEQAVAAAVAEGGDPEAAAAAAAAEDGREGTPEELEFEDDDGTIYRWDRKLRKYVPADEAADAAGAAAGAGAAGAAGANDAAGQQQQQQQQAAGYDVESMTFVAEEEVIPTLAAVRAAEEAAAAAGGKGKKRVGEAAAGQNKKAKGAEGQQAAADGADGAAADAAAPAAAPAAAGGKPAGKQQQQQQGWFELKQNTSVYVTGLPDDTDADEVAGVFAKCGIIKLDDAGQPRIKLYRDKESGMLKGDALVTYLKAPSVELACQILDATPLRPHGPNMSVTPAKFEMKGQQYKGDSAKAAAGGAAAAGAGQRKGGGGGKGGGGSKGARGGGKGGRGRGRKGAPNVVEKLERKLGWGGFDDVLPPEKVTVVLKHLFTPDEAADAGAAFAAELEADVTSECKKLGTIEKVRVFPLHPEGVVTVRFKQAEPAEACVQLMHGRFFGGHRLVAHMWDGFTQYHGVKAEVKETAEEQEARLEAFARELEAKQQREREQQQAATAAEAGSS